MFHIEVTRKVQLRTHRLRRYLSSSKFNTQYRAFISFSAVVGNGYKVGAPKDTVYRRHFFGLKQVRNRIVKDEK